MCLLIFCCKNWKILGRLTGDGSKLTQAIIIKVCPLAFYAWRKSLALKICYYNDKTLKVDLVRKTDPFLNLKNVKQFFLLGLKIDQHFD